MANPPLTPAQEAAIAAVAAPAGPNAALTALPPVTLYWRRSAFHPGLQAGAGPSWTWEPDDFTADELVSMRVHLSPSASGLGLLRLHSSALPIERPWVTDETMPGGASLRLRGQLGSSAVQVELDYRATYAGQPAPTKLAWGPGAWIPTGYVEAAPYRPREVDRQRQRLEQTELELQGLSANQEALALALAREPGLERLSTTVLESLVQTLLPGVTPQQLLNHGDVLFQAGVSLSPEVWVVLDGRVSLWLSDVLVEDRIVGQIVGCEAHLATLPPQVTARASRPTRLQPLAWPDVLAGMAACEPFRLWIEGQALSALNQAEELADIQEAASGSLFVGPQGHLLPGPYLSSEVELTLLAVGQPDTVQDLPPKLKPALVPAMRWFLLLTRFKDFDHAALPRGMKNYTEVALIRRVRLGLKPDYFWFEHIKPDNVMALCAGRQIYGYPKLWDRAHFQPNRVRLRRSSGALDVAFRSADDGSLLTQMGNPLFEEMTSIFKPPGSLSHLHFLARRRVPRLKGGWASWQPGDWHQDALVESTIEVEAMDDVEVLLRRDPDQKTVTLPLGGGQLLTMPWPGGFAVRVDAKMSLRPAGQDAVKVDYLSEALTAAEKAALKDW